MGCVNPLYRARTDSMLPEEVDGWRPAVDDEHYDFDTLFEYIDGSAELYRAFNVKSVISRQYTREGQPDIILDIFDMGSDADAFGVYRHSIREGESVGLGNESELLGSTLTFWKGPYVVSILAYDETDESLRALKKIGTRVAGAIPHKGTQPTLLNALPLGEGTVRETHYFHDHHTLNKYYFIADDNILDLDRTTEGVLARYNEKSRTGDLSVDIIIKYPSPERAENAFKAFLKTYLPDADDNGITLTENGKWTGARVIGGYVAVIFDSHKKDTALTALGEIGNALP